MKSSLWEVSYLASFCISQLMGNKLYRVGLTSKMHHQGVCLNHAPSLSGNHGTRWLDVSTDGCVFHFIQSARLNSDYSNIHPIRCVQMFTGEHASIIPTYAPALWKHKIAADWNVNSGTKGKRGVIWNLVWDAGSNGGQVSIWGFERTVILDCPLDERSGRQTDPG